MILAELRDYLRQRGEVSLQDLALHFDSDPEALRGMLEHWIRRGQVLRSATSPACGSSCSQCAPASVELYRWADAPAAAPLVRDLGRCPTTGR